MRKRSKRFISILTAIAICLSLMPVFPVLADTSAWKDAMERTGLFRAEEEKVFVRITSPKELTSGQYVMVLDFRGDDVAMTNENSETRQGIRSVENVDGKVVTGDERMIWDIDVQSDGTLTLKSGGQYLACPGNANSIYMQDEPYYWAYTPGGLQAASTASPDVREVLGYFSGEAALQASGTLSVDFDGAETAGAESSSYEGPKETLETGAGGEENGQNGGGTSADETAGDEIPGSENLVEGPAVEDILEKEAPGIEIPEEETPVGGVSSEEGAAEENVQGEDPEEDEKLLPEFMAAEADSPDSGTFLIHQNIELTTSTYVISINSSINAIRTYRYSTVTGSNYPAAFMLFRYDEDAEVPRQRLVSPVFSLESGVVPKGTEVTISSSESDVEIYYTLDGSDPTATDSGSMKYEEPIRVTETITISAVTVDPTDARAASKEASAEYRVREKYSAIIDGILEGDARGAGDIDLALQAASGTAKVIGQVTYVYGEYDNAATTTIIQDVFVSENGEEEIVGFQLYNLSNAEVGDIILATGTRSEYNGAPQFTGTSAEVLVKAEDLDGFFIAPQEYHTVDALHAEADNLLSETVILRNFVLVDYAANNSENSGRSIVRDQFGDQIEIFRASPFPEGFAADEEEVDILAILSVYSGDTVLRTGKAENNNGTPAYLILNDITPPVITLLDMVEEALVGVDYTIAANIVDNVGVESVEIIYSLDGETYGPDPMERITLTGRYEYTIPAQLITAESEILSYTITATDISGNEPAVSGPHQVEVAYKPIVESVSPAHGKATYEDNRPEVTIAFRNGGLDPLVTLTLTDSEGNVAVQDGAMSVSAEGGLFTATFSSERYEKDLEDGRYNAAVAIHVSEEASFEHTWRFTVGEPLYQAYFGQLHAHTAEYSDGSGTLAQALEHIRNIPDEDNVQFVSFTDHSNYFDSTGAANPEDALHDISLMTDASRTKWESYLNTMRSFNEVNSEMLAIPGFEMTWSGGPGHINTYNTAGLVSRNNTALNSKTSNEGLQLYYSQLKKEENKDSISQFNHPGTTFGTFVDFAYWDEDIDKMITLIEVGNGAGPVNGSGYYPSYEYYIQALDKGWHLAPTNNQDNHKADWGNANAARTVIISNDYSEEGMLEGMRNMTMYATEDKNLNIMYTVNGEIMGSVLSYGPDELLFEAQIDDPDGEPIGTVEIVVNGGRIIYQESFDTSTAEISYTLREPAYSYYFLRVVQPDKDIAVTAPVWVGETAKVGMNQLELDNDMAVRGEELVFRSAFYNYENEPAVATKMSYTVTHLGEDTVYEITEPITINAGENGLNQTFRYTPETVGVMTLTVRAEVQFGGTLYNFENSLEFEVLSSDEIVSIAIDAGHSNVYASGAYSGNLTQIKELAAQNTIRVVELGGGSLTYENLQDKGLLILTVPYGANGASIANYLYSEEEIAAIVRYADNGGNILLASKSDRQEPEAADQKAGSISNRILTALNADSRIASGVVIDETAMNNNELYRLTIGDDEQRGTDHLNLSAIGTDALAAMLLKGVEAETDHSFSIYSAAPVISNGAQVLISGYQDTTWATKFADLTSNSTVSENAAVISAPGETHFVTAENLTGGGFLVVAGGTFFSDYDMDINIDYAGQLQGVNYQLIRNIYEAIAKETVITRIAEVQAAPEGLKFTVEGIATSNASGFDRETAFFDCIYIQDETGGINIFPVDGEIQEGQRILVTGYTSSYEGERQLDLTGYSITVTDSAINPLEAKPITTEEAANTVYLGSLVEVTGRVMSFTESEGVVETICIQDDSGIPARIFINGYITAGKVIEDLEVGAEFTAIGISSIDPEGSRIRIRDRDDIRRTGDPGPQPGEGTVLSYKADKGAMIVNTDNDLPITVTSTLSIENPDNVNMVVVYFEYDAGLFEYVAHQPLCEDMPVFSIDKIRDGRVRVILGSELGGGRLKADGEINLLRLQFRSLDGALPDEAVIRATGIEVYESSNLVEFLIEADTAATSIYYIDTIYDVDANGQVNWGDLAYAMDHYMKSYEDYGEEFYEGIAGLWRMDFDDDGVITMNDYLILMAGIEEALGLQFSQRFIDLL